jgi:hypothetical protein
VPTFWRELLSPSSSTLKDTTNSSKMSLLIYEITWCHIPEECDFGIHCHKNLKSHILTLTFRKLSQDVLAYESEDQTIIQTHKKRSLETKLTFRS